MASLNRTAILRFQREIRQYYRAHGRDLPWRKTRDPYRILVSEIMLQQTQVSRVLLYYPTFLKRFPDFRALHRAPMREVLAAWQGLGYNRRALALKKIAEAVISRHGGKLPRDRESLLALPGIGQSTAGALLAFAYNIPAPFIETNIRRVFLHSFFPRGRKVGDTAILELVKKALPRPDRNGLSVADRSRAARASTSHGTSEWYYALMDYGTMLARGAGGNPNRKSRHYKVQSKFNGSNRQLRGRILKLLIAEGLLALPAIARLVGKSNLQIVQVLAQLQKEGFIVKRSRSFAIGRQ